MPSAKSIIAGGTIVAGQGRYGEACLRLNGSEWVTVLPTADFWFENGDWIIECWIKPDVALYSAPLIFRLDDANYLAFTRGAAGGSTYALGAKAILNNLPIFEIAPGGSATAGNWAHVALSRSGSTVRLFIDGAVAGSAELDTPYRWINLHLLPLYVGRGLINGVLTGFLGLLDEVRVQAGVGYSAAFTPPAGAYAATWRGEGTGRSLVRQTFAGQGSGTAAVEVTPFSVSGSGISHVRQAFSGHGDGTAGIRQVFAGEGSGFSGIEACRFSVSGSGRSGVFASFSLVGRGESGIHATVYSGEGQGTSELRIVFSGEGSGTAAVRNRFSGEGSGESVVEATDGYELFYGFGAPPDLTAAPAEVWTTLPQDYGPISGEGLHYFVLQAVDKAGYRSRNSIPWVIELDGDDEEIVLRPTGPAWVSIAAAAAGTVRVRAAYVPAADDSPADQWDVYVTNDGTDPDPASDTPTTVDMVDVEGVVLLDWTSTDQGDGNEVRVLVRTRRTSDDRDSDNTTPESVVAAATGPAAPAISAWQSRSGNEVKVG